MSLERPTCVGNDPHDISPVLTQLASLAFDMRLTRPRLALRYRRYSLVFRGSLHLFRERSKTEPTCTCEEEQHRKERARSSRPKPRFVTSLCWDEMRIVDSQCVIGTVSHLPVSADLRAASTTSCAFSPSTKLGDASRPW
jgi:hypothetical protein